MKFGAKIKTHRSKVVKTLHMRRLKSHTGACKKNLEGIR